jgi:hypothetical protein
MTTALVHLHANSFLACSANGFADKTPCVIQLNHILDMSAWLARPPG